MIEQLQKQNWTLKLSNTSGLVFTRGYERLELYVPSQLENQLSLKWGVIYKQNRSVLGLGLLTSEEILNHECIASKQPIS